MKEKQRTEEKKIGSGDSIFDGVPPMPENKNVSVSSGPYAEDLPVAGMSVGEVRRRFSDRFDIAEEAKAVLNGQDTQDDVILKAGEVLMFIHHAGEKGADKVVLEGVKATVHTPEGVTCSMPIGRLLESCGPGLSTGGVLPPGVRAILSRGSITLWFWEQPPQVRQLSWIAADSPKPYGPRTKYRLVSIALPYLIIVSAFCRNEDGNPSLHSHAECFFRNAPLKSLDDELSFPALLNCSRWGDVHGMGHPLSWICTQYLKKDDRQESGVPELIYQGGMEAVRYCLLETSFNLSSEHHEGNSWYGETKKAIPQISTVEKWEENTKKDPLFVLELPWIPTGHSVKNLAERKFKQMGYSGKGLPQNAEAVSRIIQNAS